MEEIWKDIPDYEKLYQVSNFGRVRSLPREWRTGRGALLKHDGKILKTAISGGYVKYNLYKDNVVKTFRAHQLVAMAFLDYKRQAMNLVIDHINDVKTDNRLANLQIVTQRYNTCKTQGKYSSNYKGVSAQRIQGKKGISFYYRSKININGKEKNLGSYKSEYEAHLAYQKALQEYNLI